jgi:hypothetical protein
MVLNTSWKQIVQNKMPKAKYVVHVNIKCRVQMKMTMCPNTSQLTLNYGVMVVHISSDIVD